MIERHGMYVNVADAGRVWNCIKIVELQSFYVDSGERPMWESMRVVSC